MNYASFNLPLPAALLVAPLAATLWSRYYALKANQQDSESRWLRSRRQARVMRLFLVALWWALWDSRQLGFGTPLNIILFWIPPIASIAAAQFVACWTSKITFGLKWGTAHILRLAWWNTVFPLVPLLFVAIGFEFAYTGHLSELLSGLLSLAIAGVVALVGLNRLRSAEGITLRKLKHGRFRGRAFTLAKKMGIKLEAVYVVPAGKGHLTNAYGLGRSIAITDNYGEWLD